MILCIQIFEFEFNVSSPIINPLLTFKSLQLLILSNAKLKLHNDDYFVGSNNILFEFNIICIRFKVLIVLQFCDN